MESQMHILGLFVPITIQGNVESRSKKVGAQVFLGVFACFLLYALKEFISIFLGAIVVYVLFKPLMLFLTNKLKMKNTWAALLIILLSFLIVIVPTFFVLQLFVDRISNAFSTESFMQTIELINHKSQAMFRIELINEENLKSLQVKSAEFIANALSQSLSVIGNIGIMYFILFYLLIHHSNIEKMLLQYVPIENENMAILGTELEQQVYSNVLGAPVLAAVQGVIACTGYYFFGIHDFIFWGIMTGIFSIIPVVGSAIIWIPASIYLYSVNMHWQGIALAIFGIAVISSIDNIFRFYFQKKMADVHPLITIIGVIMGLEWFGISGTIFGPLLLSYFLILVKMYRDQYNSPKP